MTKPDVPQALDPRVEAVAQRLGAAHVEGQMRDSLLMKAAELVAAADAVDPLRQEGAAEAFPYTNNAEVARLCARLADAEEALREIAAPWERKEPRWYMETARAALAAVEGRKERVPSRYEENLARDVGAMNAEGREDA